MLCDNEENCKDIFFSKPEGPGNFLCNGYILTSCCYDLIVNAFLKL